MKFLQFSLMNQVFAEYPISLLYLHCSERDPDPIKTGSPPESVPVSTVVDAGIQTPDLV